MVSSFFIHKLDLKKFENSLFAKTEHLWGDINNATSYIDNKVYYTSNALS